MQVKAESPIDAQAQPYLHKWDSAARQYHSYFEINKKIAIDNMLNLRSNPLTSWRNAIQMRDRFMASDSLTLRQQLGEISQDEVSELNRVMGITNYIYTRSRSEPAKLNSYNTMPLLALLGAGGAFGLYGKFVKRYNLLWLPASILPFCVGLVVNSANQPIDEHHNCYRYLLAKRAATCDHEKNAAQMESAELAKVKPIIEASAGQTLYDLENSLVDKISKGNF